MELDFAVFWDHYEKQNKLRNEDRRKLHYLEKSSGFTLYLKSAEFWEYFTKISISEIMAFGRLYNATKEQAIGDFKINFLSQAMPIKSDIRISKSVDKRIEKAVEPIEEEEARDYLQFLDKEFGRWEKEVLGFLDETLSDEVFSKGFDSIDKSFGEFMSRLFNVVNTSDFRAKLTTVIRRVFKDGVEDAEAELDIDIGFDASFESEVQMETNRQMDGFMIDGKVWSGLKGVAQDIQREVREVVVDGISQKQSLGDIKKEVKDVFVKNNGGTRVNGDVTEGRVMKIARTESSRFRGDAKLNSYKKSGLPLMKRWESFVDSRTSPICKRNNGQTVPLDKPFVDLETGKEFDHNPFHVNCRSTISAVIIE